MNNFLVSNTSSRDHTRIIEHGEVRHTLSRPLQLTHARWLRGAIIRLTTRGEFHNHSGNGFFYHHPLIRYDTSRGDAAVIGLAAGAVFVRSLPPTDHLRLGPDDFPVTNRSVTTDRVTVGPCPEMIRYKFLTPYLALNQENYEVWRRAGASERSGLLKRILIGNLLSLSKAIELNVATRLHVETRLEPTGFEELKPGLRLLGFRGSFSANFVAPGYWGIGKSSARGFGTIAREEA
jgi:Cas6b C-terminal domain/Cas6b N-terminal domain